MAFVAACVAIAPAVITTFTIALSRRLAMSSTWFGRATLLLAENVGESVGWQDFFAEVAFAVHALDCGADWVHGLAEHGKSHGGLIAVEHGEGVEDVEWAEDVESLEVREQEHGEVSW